MEPKVLLTMKWMTMVAFNTRRVALTDYAGRHLILTVTFTNTHLIAPRAPSLHAAITRIIMKVMVSCTIELCTHTNTYIHASSHIYISVAFILPVSVESLGQCTRNFVPDDRGCIAYEDGNSDESCIDMVGFTGYDHSYICKGGDIGYACCQPTTEFLSNGTQMNHFKNCCRRSIFNNNNHDMCISSRIKIRCHCI